MAKIQNEKVQVPSTPKLNDCDILTQILESEKNMGDNLSIALNEASNEELYQEIFSIFMNIKGLQREIYELMFSKGWYTLDSADSDKITEAKTQLSEKLNELI